MTYGFSRRFGVFYLVFCIGFSVVTLRVVYLYRHRESFINFASQARRSLKILPAKRGAILDCKGNLLALTKRVFEVGVDPLCTEKTDLKKLIELSKHIGLPVGDLEKIWTTPAKRRWKKLADGVSEETFEKIQKLKIEGVYGNAKDQRVYTGPNSLGHILGFLNKENTPVFGVERLLNFYLKGQDGIQETEKDGHQKELAQFRKRRIPCRDGYNVKLTLDANIQAIVEEVLQEAFECYHPLSVQALVSNPITGALLASVTLPAFDPNEFWKYPPEILKNRIVTDVYEPGSVFKAITVSAALNEKVVTPETKFDCGKTTVEYHGKTLSLPKDWKPLHFVMPVRDVLANSSNRGIAQISLLLGPEKLYQYARLFGFSEKTGAHFDGESGGILTSWRFWDNLTLTRIPIGHGIACTLLQMHYAVSAVANGGKLQKPYYVQNVFDTKGNIVRSFSPCTKRQVISPETAMTMCKMLLHTPISKDYIKGYNVAGKTGTTQKIIGRHYSHDKHVSSFSGFFPYDHPQIHVSLTLDSPNFKGTAYGAQVASPIFKKIADAIIGYLGIQPEPEAI